MTFATTGLFQTELGPTTVISKISWSDISLTDGSMKTCIMMIMPDLKLDLREVGHEAYLRETTEDTKYVA
jgi:hypothetical protein